MAFSSPTFHECVLRFGKPIQPILDALSEQGIFAGLAFEKFFPELQNCLLRGVTETKTKKDSDFFVARLKEIML